jgi:hypothetical protein
MCNKLAAGSKPITAPGTFHHFHVNANRGCRSPIQRECRVMTTTPDELQTAQKLESIFMPYAARRSAELMKRNGRFVHYTSAASGLNIIKSKTMWMRSTTCMSDYSEVQHGFRTLNSFFQDPNKTKNFVGTLDECASGVGQEAINLFNAWWQSIQLQTYISSLSEHDDSEDRYGRLSMWRAFGGVTARVALVLALPMESGVSEPLCILFSPVAYFTEGEVHDEMNATLAKIRENADYLRTIDRSRLLSLAFHVLVTAVVSLKHKGFHEEREWRVIYSPKRNPSRFVTSSTEVIDGVPQIVYKLPLDGSVSTDLAVLEIPNILDRIIVGPNQYPWAMYEAFVSALTEAGMKDAASRVVVSDIPIRT